MPRVIIGNIVAIMATLRALSLHLSGGDKRWDKTRHIFPAEVTR
jgi:adsorption protein B